MNTLTVNELFSGIGAQASALQRLGIPCKIIHTSDIDKDAVLSYAVVHCGLTDEMINTYTDYPTREQMTQELTQINLGYDFKENKPYNWFKYLNRKTKYIERYWLACKLSNNIGDISKIQSLDYADFWTYSFPCQSISIAGRQEGIIQGKTRSGLLYEVQRLLETAKDNNTLPKYLMLENVKNLVGKKFRPQFDEWIKWLDELGFNTYYQVLNAKDYGIPQNRERVFAISVRKDIDNNKFEFPKPFDSGIRLVNVLDDVVEDKYYLSDKMVEGFIKHNAHHNAKGTGFIWQPRDINGVASTLRANAALAATDNTIETCLISKQGRRYEHKIDEANTLLARDYKGFGNQPMNAVVEHSAVIKQKSHGFNKGGTFENCSSITTSSWQENNYVQIKDNASAAEENIRIRKLTPKECWRLMGFTDEQFTKAQSVCSDSQLYKQAGNSIVVDVLYYIFANLFEVDIKNFTQPQQK